MLNIGLKLRHITHALAVVIITTAACALASDLAIRLPMVASANEKTPDGWSVQNWKGAAEIDVIDTEIGKTLHLKSNSASTAIYKDIEFDIREYRYVNWRWKVASLPAGGDVRVKKADDQAGQLYVVFPKWPALINSSLVGYIWDSTAPEGASVASTKTSTTKYIVVESGLKHMGVWRQERRNVYEDYKRLFGAEPGAVGRVTVMIDSDDTNSRAELSIGDIYFSKD